MLKVKVYCINKGQTGQYFSLKLSDENQVLPYIPTWKTENGAIRWAERKGFKVVK